ncbi:MAG: nucleotidyltransferase domain-containing protein [Candidatus Desantisbacteria bacterium]
MTSRIRKKDLAIVQMFKSLVSMKITVQEIRIFGSRARGKATSESDLDVLVVVDLLTHEIERYVSECAWNAGFPKNVIVMPVVIARDMLINTAIKDSVFIQNVFREGVLV